MSPVVLRYGTYALTLVAAGIAVVEFFFKEQDELSGRDLARGDRQYRLDVTKYSFAIGYGFLGIALLHWEFVVKHVVNLRDELYVEEKTTRTFVLPIVTSFSKLEIILLDAIWYRSQFGISIALGSLLFNNLIVLGAISYVESTRPMKDLKMYTWEVGRNVVWYMVSLACLLYVLINTTSFCVIRAFQSELWLNTSEQVATYGANPEVICGVGVTSWIEGGFLLFFFFCFQISLLSDDYFRRCCTAQVNSTMLSFGSHLDEHHEAIHIPEYKSDNKSFVCYCINVNKGKQQVAEDTSLRDEIWDSMPYGVLLLPYVVFYHIVLTVPYSYLQDSSKIRGSTYVLFMSAGITACQAALVLMGLRRLSNVVEVDDGVLGFGVSAAFACLVDFDSALSIVRRGLAASAVAFVFSCNMTITSLGLGFAWLVGGIVYQQHNVVDVNGPWIWTLIAFFCPLIYLALAKWGRQEFEHWHLYITAILYLLLIFLFNVLPPYCLLGICQELDCDRCGYPSLFYSGN